MKEVSFGMFLRSLREENGLSQAQLGRLAGVSDKAVSKWESDAARPQSGLLRRLADLLGVTVDELLSCRRRPPEKASQKDALQRKDRLWKAAHRALCGRYGEQMPHEVLNRWLSEYEELRTTDAILCFELLRCLRARAAETGAHVLVRGALGSSFVAFVLGATEVNPLRRIPCVRIAAGSSGRTTSAAEGTSPRRAAPAARCRFGTATIFPSRRCARRHIGRGSSFRFRMPAARRCGKHSARSLRISPSLRCGERRTRRLKSLWPSPMPASRRLPTGRFCRLKHTATRCGIVPP